MLTVVTNRDSNHRVPRVDPVPVGSIDAFGRDDGWIGDRPADCGNFWLDRSNVEDPPYLSGGVMTMTPGVGSFLGSIWLGGSAVGVAFDVYTGSAMSSIIGLFCYIVADERPEFEGEQVIVNLFSSNTTIVKSSGAVLSTSYAGAGSSASTAYRFYVTARPLLGGWHVLVERSAPDGSGRAAIVSGVIDSAALPGWLSFGTSSGATGITVDNVERLAVAEPPPYADDMKGGIPSGWTANQGTWASDSVGTYTTTGNDNDTLTRDFGYTDMIVRVTLAAIPSGMGGGPQARYIDANGYFLLFADSSANQLSLIRRSGGTTTTIAGPTGYSATAGDVLELSTIGDAIGGRLLRGGAVISSLSATSTANATGTRCGFRTGYTPSGTIRFADFTVDG